VRFWREKQVLLLLLNLPFIVLSSQREREREEEEEEDEGRDGEEGGWKQENLSPTADLRRC